MNVWGEKLKISIFGESHGEGIGIVIDGIPAGIELDMEEIARQMRRRAPGRNAVSTSRFEPDEVKILSGFFHGRTTGTPLAGVILNTNTRSKDYTPELLRPGHADFTGFAKYGASHDYRGGGHFSGRVTAPLVFAGAVAMQILAKQDITVGSHILQIGKIRDQAFDPVKLDADTLRRLGRLEFPVLEEETRERMQQCIIEKKREKDSVGGILECGVVGLKTGIGSPFFGSVESRIASIVYSVPAVKGIEFGAGFRFAEMTGSEANDAFYIQNGKIQTRTNHNAGINGGITNGMPIVFRTVIKPTPSIAQVQQTVNLKTMENAEIEIHGRHDPCIVPRAAVVVEAAAAIALLDMIETE